MFNRIVSLLVLTAFIFTNTTIGVVPKGYEKQSALRAMSIVMEGAGALIAKMSSTGMQDIKDKIKRQEQWPDFIKPEDMSHLFPLIAQDGKTYISDEKRLYGDNLHELLNEEYISKDQNLYIDENLKALMAESGREGTFKQYDQRGLTYKIENNRVIPIKGSFDIINVEASTKALSVLGYLLSLRGKCNKRALVASDPEDYNQEAVDFQAEIFRKAGFDVVAIRRPVPSPLIYALQKLYNCDLLAYGSGSHNPYGDRGIKWSLISETTLCIYGMQELLKKATMMGLCLKDAKEKGALKLVDNRNELELGIDFWHEIHKSMGISFNADKFNIMIMPLYSAVGLDEDNWSPLIALLERNGVKRENIKMLFEKMQSSRNLPKDPKTGKPFQPNPELTWSREYAEKEFLKAYKLDSSKIHICFSSDRDADRLSLGMVVLNKDRIPEVRWLLADSFLPISMRQLILNKVATNPEIKEFIGTVDLKGSWGAFEDPYMLKKGGENYAVAQVFDKLNVHMLGSKTGHSFLKSDLFAQLMKYKEKRSDIFPIASGEKSGHCFTTAVIDTNEIMRKNSELSKIYKGERSENYAFVLENPFALVFALLQYLDTQNTTIDAVLSEFPKYETGNSTKLYLDDSRANLDKTGEASVEDRKYHITKLIYEKYKPMIGRMVPGLNIRLADLKIIEGEKEVDTRFCFSDPYGKLPVANFTLRASSNELTLTLTLNIEENPYTAELFNIEKRELIKQLQNWVLFDILANYPEASNLSLFLGLESMTGTEMVRGAEKYGWQLTGDIKIKMLKDNTYEYIEKKNEIGLTLESLMEKVHDKIDKGYRLIEGTVNVKNPGAEFGMDISFVPSIKADASKDEVLRIIEKQITPDLEKIFASKSSSVGMEELKQELSSFNKFMQVDEKILVQALLASVKPAKLLTDIAEMGGRPTMTVLEELKEYSILSKLFPNNITSVKDVYEKPVTQSMAMDDKTIDNLIAFLSDIAKKQNSNFLRAADVFFNCIDSNVFVPRFCNSTISDYSFVNFVKKILAYCPSLALIGTGYNIANLNAVKSGKTIRIKAENIVPNEVSAKYAEGLLDIKITMPGEGLEVDKAQFETVMDHYRAVAEVTARKEYNSRGNVWQYYQEFLNTEVPIIQEFIKQQFGSYDNLKYVFLHGQGANVMFARFISAYQNAFGQGPKLIILSSAADIKNKTPDDANDKNSIVIDESRSGDTQEILKLFQLTYKRFPIRIVYANKGPLKIAAETFNKRLWYSMLVRPMPQDIGGRHMRRKSPMLLAPMYLSSGRSFCDTYMKATDRFDKQLSFAKKEQSLAVLLSRFAFVNTVLGGKHNFAVMYNNKELLDASAKELKQLWMEGANKEEQFSLIMGLHNLPDDAHASMEGVLAQGDHHIGLGIIAKRSGYSYDNMTVITKNDLAGFEDDENQQHAGLNIDEIEYSESAPNISKCADKMPLIYITVEQVTPEVGAALSTLFEDFNIHYCELTGQNPHSNPQVKGVREGTGNSLSNTAKEKAGKLKSSSVGDTEEIAKAVLDYAPDVDEYRNIAIPKNSQGVIVYSDALLNNPALQALIKKETSVEKAGRRFYLVDKTGDEEKGQRLKTEYGFDIRVPYVGEAETVGQIKNIVQKANICQLRIFAQLEGDYKSWSIQNFIDVLIMIMQDNRFDIISNYKDEHEAYIKGYKQVLRNA